jgi:hypothetical protein
MLVICAVRLTRFFLTREQESFRWRVKKRLSIESRIGNDPRYTDSAEHIQFISIEEDLGFQCIRWFILIPEAVSPDAVLDSCNALFTPTFCRQNLSSEICRSPVVILAPGILARCGALSIMQQCGRAYDLQVCTFSSGEAFSHAVNAQDMIEVMDSVGGYIPGSGLFGGWHVFFSPLNIKLSAGVNPAKKM